MKTRCNNNNTRGQFTNALRAVRLQEFSDQILGVGVEMARILHFAQEDLLVDLKLGLVVEGRIAREHLVDEHPWIATPVLNMSANTKKSKGE